MTQRTTQKVSKKSTLLHIIASVTLTLTLSACSQGPFPYRIDIDQGNIITPTEISQLQIGMTKLQVQYVLGSSLLIDIFHQDRWDYVQQYKRRSSSEVERSHVSLFFNNGKLVSIQNEGFKEIQQDAVPYSIER